MQGKVRRGFPTDNRVIYYADAAQLTWECRGFPTDNRVIYSGAGAGAGGRGFPTDNRVIYSSLA